MPVVHPSFFFILFGPSPPHDAGGVPPRVVRSHVFLSHPSPPPSIKFSFLLHPLVVCHSAVTTRLLPTAPVPTPLLAAAAVCNGYASGSRTVTTRVAACRRRGGTAVGQRVGATVSPPRASPNGGRGRPLNPAAARARRGPPSRRGPGGGPRVRAGPRSFVPPVARCSRWGTPWERRRDRWRGDWAAARRPGLPRTAAAAAAAAWLWRRRRSWLLGVAPPGGAWRGRAGWHGRRDQLRRRDGGAGVAVGSLMTRQARAGMDSLGAPRLGDRRGDARG